MSAAEILTRAAALMRDRAEAAIASLSDNVPEWHSVRGLMGDGKTHGDAQHIASWDPVIALRISDWLLRVADDAIRDNYRPDEYESAVDIANLYLGEQQP